MKKLIFLLLSFVTFSLIAENSGFNSYLEKDYKKAKELFTKDFKEDMGPLVSYNLGVTSEALNKPGEAVYYYIQALQRAPELEEAKSNLDLLVKEKGITVPKKLLEPYNAVNAVLIVFFITLYLFAGLIVLYTFVPDWKIKMALLPLFLVMTVSAAFYFIEYNRQSEQNWAVVVSDDALRSGPDESLKEIGSLKEGEIINVVSSSGSWYKVKSFQDNVEGWVKFEKIKAVARGYK